LPSAKTTLALQALAYVHKLYAELMAGHAAPGLGTQNQAVHFILDDAELSSAVARWAATTDIEEASARPPRKVPHDELYRRVREYLEKSRPGVCRVDGFSELDT
jgi:hypothetical protein